jgi:hypothetical protein
MSIQRLCIILINYVRNFKLKTGRIENHYRDTATGTILQIRRAEDLLWKTVEGI